MCWALRCGPQRGVAAEIRFVIYSSVGILWPHICSSNFSLVTLANVGPQYPAAEHHSTTIGNDDDDDSLFVR